MAPGAVVPETVTVASVTFAPGVGEVIVTGNGPGIPWLTYRSVTICGVSRSRPALRSIASRAYWAWAQVSGLAEPAAPPSVKPIDAVVGSVPYGEAARSGSSQACSGSRPWPDCMFCIDCSRLRADDGSAAARSYSPRSPLSTGHRWPVPVSVGGHGAPGVVQLEPLG